MNILDRYHENKPETKTEERVFAFLNELMDRKGFDDWWGNVDGFIRIEILESLVESIGKIHQ